MDYSKIEEIFDQFSHKIDQNNIKKNPPKLWNIDTCEFNTWKRFSENLKKNNIQKGEAIECIVKCVAHNPKNNAPRYLIYINGKDVTPFKKSESKQNWSKGGTRQFLQVASALNVIYFDDQLNTSEKKYEINSEINEFLNDEINWNSIIYKVINRSLKTTIQSIRNFGFSLFVTILFSFDNSIFDVLKIKTFYKIMTKSIKSETANKKNPFTSNDQYCKEYLKKIYEETYKNLITDFKKENNTVDIFIKNVYLYIFNKWEGQEENGNDILDCEIKNLIREIKNERNKFRDNMMNDRFPDKKIPIYYSDLLYEDSQEIYERPMGELKAAHLYEVKTITKDAKNILMKEYKVSPDSVKFILSQIIPCVSNPKNGIFIPGNIHDAFDNGEIGFNSNGKMIVQKEEIKKYHNEKLIISPKIFNDEMREFLNKR